MPINISIYSALSKFNIRQKKLLFCFPLLINPGGINVQLNQQKNFSHPPIGPRSPFAHSRNFPFPSLLPPPYTSHLCFSSSACVSCLRLSEAPEPCRSVLPEVMGEGRWTLLYHYVDHSEHTAHSYHVQLGTTILSLASNYATWVLQTNCLLYSPYRI